MVVFWILLLLVAVVGVWVYVQLRPTDISPSAYEWTKGMGAEEIEQTVTALLSQRWRSSSRPSATT